MKKITLQIFIWVFLAIPIVASASDRRECTYVNLMAGNTWGNDPNSIKDFKSWFPATLSFSKESVNFFGENKKFYDDSNGLLSALIGFSVDNEPTRMIIDTNEPMRIKIKWPNYKDTNWIKIKCNKPKATKTSASPSNQKPIKIRDWDGVTFRGSFSCGDRDDQKGKFTFKLRGNTAVLRTGPAGLPYTSTITESSSNFWRQSYKNQDGNTIVRMFKVRQKADKTELKGTSEPTQYDPCVVKISGKTERQKSYVERCEISSEQIKLLQSQLKRLDLYPYEIDGLAGKGTLAGLKKAKKLVGADASKGECFTKADISAFTELADNKEQKSTNTCSSKNTKVCTDLYLCAFSTKSENDIRKWLKPNTSFYKSFINEANRRGLGCNVGQPYSEKLTAENVLSTRCSPENIEQCSDDTVCEKATLLRSGVRSWNFDAATYVDRAKDLSLDCKITIDNTPFSKEEAIYYLSQLVDFVSKNPTDFDLKFASEFNKVRSITEGAWSTELSKEFESFRVYIAKFPKFQQYLEELRLANEAAALKRVAQLREALNQDMEVLKEWAQLNVLDSKAAEIAMLDANLGDKSLQDVNKLEQLLAEAQRLVSATGLKDGPLKEVTKELVDNLYDPSSIYVFANTSGDAANLYKNLEGVFTFEQDKGSYCATNKIDAFDFILLRNSLFENFSGVTAFDQECSEASDIYVAKGNELTTERLFNLINLSDLTQVSQLSKADRDKEYDRLMFLKETIQNDVLAGTRLGFGLLKSGDVASKLCAIIDGNEQGHQEQLKRNELLIKALGLKWNGFEKVTLNSEEAFKFIQRGECDAIYAGSLNLGRLYLAGEIADVSFEFIPVWVSKSSVEESQKAYEENMAASAQANAEAKKNLEDQAKLDEQAKKSLAESAAIRQRELREQNGLRFMVLRDELQEQVLAASNFGFENSSEESGYIKKYLAQPFVDQTTRYSAFDTIIADMQKLKSERWEITEQRLDQIDFGEAKFKGRLVDALQVELKIASKNRLVGKYSEYCRSIVAIKDEDFEMWRNTTISDCSNEAALSKWKLENAFQSKWIVKQ